MDKRGKAKCEGADKISELPDEILSHILSFLPSMESVATCLLSKRWGHLWEMVPTLGIQWFPPVVPMVYRTKVNEFLRLRRTKKITRLHIDCEIYNHFYLSELSNINNNPANCLGHMKEWVDEAITGEVEHVNLDLHVQIKHGWFPMDGLVSVPIRLLTCTTIVTMKIEAPSINLFVPSGIQLPSLKSLYLNVQKCERANCKEFISGSPALQVFYLKQKSLDSKLRIERNSRRNIIVSDEGLLKLVIQSDCAHDYVEDYLEGDLENIVKAKVSMTLNPEKNWSRGIIYRVYSHADSILKTLRNVEFLSLHDPFESNMDNFSHDVPQFSNLVHLNLHVKDLHHSPCLKLRARCPKLEKYCLNDCMREL